MRDWHLTADSPLAMRFAADARLGRVDYADDQSWEVMFGGPQEPGLSFTTRYGGRAGLARLVPMWVIDGRAMFEGAALAGKPVLQRFAPNYAKISVQILNTLALTVDLWVMDSHAVGGRFVLENSADKPISLQLQLFAQVVREGEVGDMNLLALDNGAEALHLGEIGNLNPILMMDYAVHSTPPAGERRSPKLSASITIPAKGWSTVRWVHAGNPTIRDSLQNAFRWLYQSNWDEAFAQIERLNDPLPMIETGNADWDAAIAFSQQIILRSFVGPTGALPNASYVSARIPSRGYSSRADGSDHGAQWNGQTAALGYLALPAAAILAPDLAKGAVKNALAVQNPDGWIDFKPGLGGQRANLLSVPLWATIAWRIYELTDDKPFIADVYDGLRRFFERWFQRDMDRDQDGLPEWTTAAQSGHGANPAFVRFLRSSQNADISKAETPDLAAYLISEGRSLLSMAQLLGKTDTADLQTRIDKLWKHLDAMWNADAASYLYRDRDTDQTLAGKSLFRGKGDSAFDSRTALSPANRLILRVIGGKDHAPRMSATIEGIDHKGAGVSETVSASAFAWSYGMGAAVSEHVYSQVNYVKFEGLSRVYSVEIDTVDLTERALTQLLPLWADPQREEKAKDLLGALSNQQTYNRPFGFPSLPANDPAFGNEELGGQSVWLLWNTMLIEGLVKHHFTDEAATQFGRLVQAPLAALRRYRAFRETYNSETGEGQGDADELVGIMPLALLLELGGIRILNARNVKVGGSALPSLKVTQYGIEATRSADKVTIHFPTGYTTEVQSGADWQLVSDPTPEPTPEPAPQLEPVAAPPAPETAPQESNAPAEPTPDASAPAPSPEPTPPAAEPVAPPAPAAIIPVDAKKDDTLDIPISQIDFTPKDKPDSTPGVIKIPVRGPDE